MTPYGIVSHRGAIYTSSDFGANWIFRMDGDFFYNGLSCSSDGVKVVAANGEGGVYLSNDRGATWSKSSADDQNGNFWVTVTSSYQGQFLAAGSWNSGIYISSNYGSSWTLSTAPEQYWISLSSDASGQYLAAGSVTGKVGVSDNIDPPKYGCIYISTNYGSSWSHSNAPVGNWLGIVSAGSGPKLVAVEERGETPDTDT